MPEDTITCPCGASLTVSELNPNSAEKRVANFYRVHANCAEQNG